MTEVKDFRKLNFLPACNVRGGAHVHAQILGKKKSRRCDKPILDVINRNNLFVRFYILKQILCITGMTGPVGMVCIRASKS
jgi:hypothetical protein